MNHYQIMRAIAAKERLGITPHVNAEIPDVTPPKPLPPASFKPVKEKVDKSIYKICPICGVEFRLTPCHSNYKTCRKPDCVKTYRVIFIRRPQTYRKCQGKDCCNYLDSFYRQKTYCSRYCCSHSVRNK